MKLPPWFEQMLERLLQEEYNRGYAQCERDIRKLSDIYTHKVKKKK
jgi:hypothetical protein